ncbi:S1C family serine protease [Humibacillus sp. DSM 29435]|uniref:S1C family serine protease n=1 Tax=Humibacillus sp. DSM 29435 TaxID=1869167 RepID=UPI000AEDA610|nr:trypsin-like peptidase domain-containing protein [Humibacillus sp. DSM 29435]
MTRLVPPPETAVAEPSGAVDRERDRPWGRTQAALARRTPAWVTRLSKRGWVAVAALVVVALALTGFLLTRPPGPAPITTRDVEATVQKNLDEQARAQAAAPSAASVAYTAIQPSLVVIATTQTTAKGQSSGSGAGVIVNADGTILTALHVVDGAQTIKVTYADGTSSDATIAKSQRDNDIATLTPADPPQTIVPAVLGGGLPVGAPVFAVGHPLGLVDSLSAGVVSALDRTVAVEGGRVLKHLIQIDAAVNPGNSGGPLLNRAGQVVGIVTGLANPSDQSTFVGIGFAVPIATAGGAAGSPPQ